MLQYAFGMYKTYHICNIFQTLFKLLCDISRLITTLLIIQSYKKYLSINLIINHFYMPV